MNDKIEIKPQVISPLKKICMSIGELPTSYLETMTYYEMLIWFTNYLRDTIIPVVNNNGEAVTELQNLFVELQTYVNDYFDNLDVQEEINNKLDEMLEDGVLEQIIEQFLQLTSLICFDKVADMKTSVNLANGSYAKTLGYYSKNDGGGALYKIREITNADVIDDGFIVSITASTNLVGELVIENSINVNSLGADSTGENDSSTIIQNAMNFIENRWLNGEYSVNTLVFDGTYLINDTLEMSPFVRLTGDGYTIFKTNTSPALWIHYVNGIIPDSFPGNKQRYAYANLIDFPKGCLFVNEDETLQNTCIEIGERTNLTTTHNIARFKLANFSIQNYNIGLLYNEFNVYICNHERIHIENNNIGVQFGHHTTNGSNAGEHMLFDNCLIGACTYGFKYEISGFDLSIVNSSLDFNTYVISDPYAKGYHKINISNSHIEGNNNLFGTLSYPVLINVINNTLYTRLDAENDYQFMTLADAQTSPNVNDLKLCICNVKDNKLGYPTVGTTSNPSYITFKSYIPINNQDNYLQSGTAKLQVQYGNILNGVFDGLADGDITVSTGSSIGQLKVVGNARLKATGTIVTDNYLYTGHKSLILYKNGSEATASNFNIETALLPIRKSTYLANWYSYNKRTGGSVRFVYYDKDGNQLSQGDAYQYHPNLPTTNNVWYMSAYCQKAIVPANATYFKVVFSLGDWNNSTAQEDGTQYKLGGIIIE